MHLQNAKFPISVTEDVIVNCGPRMVQLRNASPSILTREIGESKLTEAKEVQVKNVPNPILVTEDGMVIVVKAVIPNTLSSILLTEHGASNVTDAKLVQLPNTPGPRFVTEDGIIKEERLVSSNALLRISVTEDGIMIGSNW